jgi:exodeoxyribonuclease V alpha subunit
LNHLVRPRPLPPPRGRHIVRFLADRPEFSGVGPATAQRLWDAWGEDLYRILGDGDVESLAEILPRTQAEIIVDAWRNQRAITDTVVFFDELGLDDRLARKAVEFWGDEAVAKLRDNPYRLLTVCPWTRVDRGARLLGIAADDERRLVGAVEAALYDRLDQKHTATSRCELVRRVMRLLAAPLHLAERALAAAAAATVPPSPPRPGTSRQGPPTPNATSRTAWRPP